MNDRNNINIIEANNSNSLTGFLQMVSAATDPKKSTQLLTTVPSQPFQNQTSHKPEFLKTKQQSISNFISVPASQTPQQYQNHLKHQSKTFNQVINQKSEFMTRDDSDDDNDEENNKSNYPIHQKDDSFSEISRKSTKSLDLVMKQGFSNTKLNPSMNSGLETDLSVNPSAIQYWYYTLGKSFREYQFNIVKTCLSNNTLVALPTGLGKTFIAATVMLNYYLWFPRGKIFFLAPTRPLVNQQIECLKQFEQIQERDIFEMTGNYPIPKRSAVYQSKRIFFQTPQTLENDLQEGRYNGKELALIIFDEAHRATGKYAYVNIIKNFELLGKGYRILALSATPGNEFEQIQEVIRNLCVAKMEMKDEEDVDVKQYVHTKDIILVKISANDMLANSEQILSNMIFMLFSHLKSRNVIPPNLHKIVRKPADIGKGISFQIIEHLKKNRDAIIEDHNQSGLSEAYDYNTVLAQLIHGKKLIMEQGINCFRDWLYAFRESKNQKSDKPSKCKQKLLASPEFTELWKFIKMDSYVPNPAKQKKEKKGVNKRSSSKDSGEDSLNFNFAENRFSSTSNNRGQSENSRPFNETSSNTNSNSLPSATSDSPPFTSDIESHPKSEKLIELLSDYFMEEDNIAKSSKTIVFTQSRSSASELKRLLNSTQLKSSEGENLFRGEIFIGQANADGNGMNQKLQIETINLFKQGVYNILIATCIGEEGLDIGDVDLIICYDSGFSPIRMIQRMGRTGRKRAGKVYILLMEGKEYASYIQSQKKHKELNQLLKHNSTSTTNSEVEVGQKNRGRSTKANKRMFEFFGYNPRMIPSEVNPICRIVQNQGIVKTPSQSEDEQQFGQGDSAKENSDDNFQSNSSDDDFFDSKCKRRGIVSNRASDSKSNKLKAEKKSKTSSKGAIETIEEEEQQQQINPFISPFVNQAAKGQPTHQSLVNNQNALQQHPLQYNQQLLQQQQQLQVQVQQQQKKDQLFIFQQQQQQQQQQQLQLPALKNMIKSKLSSVSTPRIPENSNRMEIEIDTSQQMMSESASPLIQKMQSRRSTPQNNSSRDPTINISEQEKEEKQRQAEDRVRQLARNVNGKNQHSNAMNQQLHQLSTQSFSSQLVLLNRLHENTAFSSSTSSNSSAVPLSVFSENQRRNSINGPDRLPMFSLLPSQSQQINKVPLKKNSLSSKKKQAINNTVTIIEDNDNQPIVSNQNIVLDVERNQSPSSSEQKEVMFIKRLNPNNVFNNFDQQRNQLRKNPESNNTSVDNSHLNNQVPQKQNNLSNQNISSLTSIQKNLFPNKSESKNDNLAALQILKDLPPESDSDSDSDSGDQDLLRIAQSFQSSKASSVSSHNPNPFEKSHQLQIPNHHVNTAKNANISSEILSQQNVFNPVQLLNSNDQSKISNTIAKSKSSYEKQEDNDSIQELLSALTSNNSNSNLINQQNEGKKVTPSVNLNHHPNGSIVQSNKFINTETNKPSQIAISNNNQQLTNQIQTLQKPTTQTIISSSNIHSGDRNIPQKNPSNQNQFVSQQNQDLSAKTISQNPTQINFAKIYDDDSDSSNDSDEINAEELKILQNIKCPQSSIIPKENGASLQQNKNIQEVIIKEQVKDFKGIKEIIMDKSKSIQQIGTQNIVVSQKLQYINNGNDSQKVITNSSSSLNQKQQNQDDQFNPKIEFKQPNTIKRQPVVLQQTPNTVPNSKLNNALMQTNSIGSKDQNTGVGGNRNAFSGSADAEKLVESGSASKSNLDDADPPKKKLYQLRNEQFKKDLEKDFDAEEWSQREKNKVVKEPLSDPKAMRAQKKKQQQQNSAQSNSSSQQPSVEVISSSSDLGDPSLNKQQQQTTNKGQSDAASLLDPFKDLFSVLDKDSQESSSSQSSSSKNPSKKNTYQEVFQDVSSRKQSTGSLRKENPYLSLQVQASPAKKKRPSNLK